MERLIKVLAAILKVRPKDVNDTMSPQNTPSWDSFNSILLADALEKEFKTKFTMDEILDVKNVGDIKRHLRNHGIKL